MINDFGTMDSTSLAVFLIIGIGFFVLFFMVIRGLTLWYFRINEHIANQERIISLLTTIANQGTPLASIAPLQPINTAQEPSPSMPRRNPLTGA